MTVAVASLLLGHSLSGVRVLSVYSVCIHFHSNSAHGKFHSPVTWEGTSQTLERMLTRLAEINHESCLWGQCTSPKKTGSWLLARRPTASATPPQERTMQLSKSDDFLQHQSPKGPPQLILFPFTILRLPHNPLFVGSCGFSIFYQEMKC